MAKCAILHFDCQMDITISHSTLRYVEIDKCALIGRWAFFSRAWLTITDNHVDHGLSFPVDADLGELKKYVSPRSRDDDRDAADNFIP